MSNENLSPAARKTAIKNAISEGSNTLLQISAHKEHLKEVINHIAEEYEMDKGVIRDLINIYHKQNISEVKNKSEDLLEKYEEIFKEDMG